MKTMTREDVIKRLTDSRVDTSMQDRYFLSRIFEDGNLVGFNYMSNPELIIEYKYEFNEAIEIIY